MQIALDIVKDCAFKESSLNFSDVQITEFCRSRNFLEVDLVDRQRKRKQAALLPKGDYATI